MTDDERDIDELLAHGPWLERLAHSIVRDPHAAEDAIQSTWLSAMRNPPNRAVRVRAWLRTVLLNAVRQQHRKHERRERHELLAAPEARDAGRSSDHVSELSQELAELVANLPEPHRSVLLLHFFDELTSNEIGKRLGMPAATVRGHLMKGLHRLRTELERRHRGSPLELVLLPLLGDRETTVAPSASERAGTSVSPRASWLSNPLFYVAAALLVAVGWLVIAPASAPTPAGELVARADAPPPSSELDSTSGIADRRAVVSTAIASSPSIAGVEEPAKTISLDVEVVDAFGRSSGDASVLVFRRASAAFEEAARTDALGQARIGVDQEDVGAWGGKGAGGRVALRATNSGWAASDVVFAAIERNGARVRLVLPARESVLSGRVVDEAGHPIAAADIELGYAQANQLSGVARADPSMPQPVRATSDEDGRFLAHGVDGSGGRVRVHASHAGFLPTFVEQVVDGARERECTLVLVAGGRVQGRVLDPSGDAVPFAHVWYEPVERGGDAAFRSVGYAARLRGWTTVASADETGEFELTAIPSGNQHLWAQDPARPHRITHIAMPVASGSSVTWNPTLEERDPFEVVLDTGARTHSGWIVRLFFQGPIARCIREGETDADGIARFFDVCADAIDVSVYAADTGFLSARARVDRTQSQSARIALEEPARVAGQLLDAGGGVFEDGILRLVPKEGLAPWTQLSYDAKTGAFEHALPAGAYLLIASHAGSNAMIAALALEPGVRHELGAVQVPKLARLRIDHAGAAPPDLEYRILQLEPVLPPSVNPRVEIGSWPPPEERTIFPGKYAIEVGSFLAKEARVDHRVVIEIAAGQDARVQIAP